MSADFPVVIPETFKRALRGCVSWGSSRSCSAKKDDPRVSGRFESGHGDPISAAQRQNHGIPIGFHVTLAAGVLAIASPLGDGWLAMLDSYIRAFLSSAATSFIC